MVATGSSGSKRGVSRNCSMIASKTAQPYAKKVMSLELHDSNLITLNSGRNKSLVRARSHVIAIKAAGAVILEIRERSPLSNSGSGRKSLVRGAKPSKAAGSRRSATTSGVLRVGLCSTVHPARHRNVAGAFETTLP